MSPSLTTSDDGEKKIKSSPKADEEEEKINNITTSSPNVTLKTTNGETFEVAIDVISLSQTIKHMIEDGCAGEFIPVPNVDGKILAKVIEYCQKHYKSGDDDEKKKDEIRQWDIDFITNITDSVVMELTLAANYLDIKGLFDLNTQKIADTIKDLSLGEVRNLFGLTRDFEPGEIDKLKKAHGDSGWNENDQ